MEYKRRFNSLTELRKYHRMSLGYVAKQLCVTPATIWQWEQKPNSWLKQKHRLQLQRVFSQEDISEAFDPDWKPNEQEPEENKEIIEDTIRSENDILFRELTSVFTGLSDTGKRALVEFADYLYHREKGLTLPKVFTESDI